MELRPLLGHGQGLVGQIALQHLLGLDVDGPNIFAINEVDMGRVVLPAQEVHLDHHTVEP